MEDASFAWERLEHIAATVGIEITWSAVFERWEVDLGNGTTFYGTDLADVVAEARRSLA